MINNELLLKQNPKSIELGIANRLRQIRKAIKISQAQLANDTGVSLGSIRRFEKTGLISLSSLIKISRRLDALDEMENLFTYKLSLLK
ncbi:MAG: helix-turn-helix transcriptional regulator [Spirochaetaceae bacterium]|nr:helix-turn-helix transcriptional regulator [Spirochaetaceae bacterium]